MFYAQLLIPTILSLFNNHSSLNSVVFHCYLFFAMVSKLDVINHEMLRFLLLITTEYIFYLIYVNLLERYDLMICCSAVQIGVS